MKVVTYPYEEQKYRQRVKNYFHYIRKTTDWKPKPPKNRMKEFKDKWEKGEPTFKKFKSDDEVRRWKMDWILEEEEHGEEIPES